MPLVKGTSKSTRTKNIKEILGSYKRTGKIGSSRPKSKFKAIKQATAIAYKNKKGR